MGRSSYAGSVSIGISSGVSGIVGGGGGALILGGSAGAISTPAA